MQQARNRQTNIRSVSLPLPLLHPTNLPHPHPPSHCPPGPYSIHYFHSLSRLHPCTSLAFVSLVSFVITFRCTSIVQQKLIPLILLLILLILLLIHTYIYLYHSTILPCYQHFLSQILLVYIYNIHNNLINRSSLHHTHTSMSLPNQKIALPSIKNIFDVINLDMSQPNSRQQQQQQQNAVPKYQQQFLPQSPSPRINQNFTFNSQQQIPTYPTPTNSSRNVNLVQSNNNIQTNDSKNNNYTTSLKFYHNMYNNPQQRFTANIITSGSHSNGSNSPPTSPLPHPMLTAHVLDNRTYSDLPNHLSLSSASSTSSTTSSTTLIGSQNNIKTIDSISNNDLLSNKQHNNKVLKKHSVKRSNLPKRTVEILNDWLLNHLHDPYPTPHEKMELLGRTGLTKIQLSNWFINVRRRKVFADHSNNHNDSIIGANITGVHQRTASKWMESL